MGGILVLWIAIVAFAAIIVVGAVVPGLFVRTRGRRYGGRRSGSPWTALGVFVAGLILVSILTIVLADRLSTMLDAYWAWSFPAFFLLAAIFVGWFFRNAGYPSDTKALGILLVLAFGSGYFAYVVQPLPWTLGHFGIP